MTLGVPITSAPRVVAVPLAATAVAPVLARLSPFEPGQSVLAQSAGAGQIFGSCHPGKNDPTRYLKFIVKSADVAAAASTLGQVAAARDASGNVTGDLTVSLGTVAAPLAIGLLPVMSTSISADDLLNAIVLVNGVPYARITDATAPNPSTIQWGLDSDTEIGTILVIGASTGANLIRVGSEVEIIKPDSTITALLMKATMVAGAALVASVPEERLLSAPVVTTDTAGRSVTRPARVDFLAADVAAVTLLGLSK